MAELRINLFDVVFFVDLILLLDSTKDLSNQFIKLSYLTCICNDLD